MSAQRTNVTAPGKLRGQDALDALDRLHAALREDNPDFTDEDWDRLAEEWAEAVNEGLREHVRRHNEEFERSRR